MSWVTPSNRFHSKKRAKFSEALVHLMMPGVVKGVRDVPSTGAKIVNECAGDGLMEGMKVEVLITMLSKE